MSLSVSSPLNDVEVAAVSLLTLPGHLASYKPGIMNTYQAKIISQLKSELYILSSNKAATRKGRRSSIRTYKKKKNLRAVYPEVQRLMKYIRLEQCVAEEYQRLDDNITQR